MAKGRGQRAYTKQRPDVLPPVVCKDGFSMSVQAGRYNYSEPADFVELYTELEVANVSYWEPRLMPYRELGGSDIYVNVPAKVLAEVVADHGGVVRGPWRFECMIGWPIKANCRARLVL